MITCEFKTSGEAENLELSESVWEAIRSWIEFEKKRYFSADGWTKRGIMSQYLLRVN